MPCCGAAPVHPSICNLLSAKTSCILPQSKALSAASEGSGSLHDAHRFAFLQAIIQKKWMPESEARSLFRELCNLAGEEAAFLDTIAALNDRLSLLLMGIRMVKSPVDKTSYIGFVNKQNDQIAKENGTLLTIPQIQYLRSVITAIAIDEDAVGGAGSLSGIQCGHIRAGDDLLTQMSQAPSQSQAKQMSLSQKNDAMDLFVKEGWLMETPGHRGYYSLGVRTFLELHELLLNLPIPAETRNIWETFL